MDLLTALAKKIEQREQREIESNRLGHRETVKHCQPYSWDWTPRVDLASVPSLTDDQAELIASSERSRAELSAATSAAMDERIEAACAEMRRLKVESLRDAA